MRRQDLVQVLSREWLVQQRSPHVLNELRILIDLQVGGHEHDPLDEVRMRGSHLPVECRPVHRRHPEVAEDQIVHVGADSFERLLSIGDGLDLADSIAPDQMGDEVTEEHIVVNHKDARTFETRHVNVTVRAAIAWFTIRKTLATDRTEVGHRFVDPHSSSHRLRPQSAHEAPTGREFPLVSRR